MTERRHHTVQVPATTANLGPGFDALGAAVGLHLYARSLPRDAYEARVTTSGEGADDLPTDDDNLVWRSLVDLCEAVDEPVPDVCLRVANGVPLERGLGSSSAAIVAGLGLGRALTGAPIGDLELARLADRIEGHPDNVVPAIVGGVTASVVDDSGHLVVRRVDPAPRLRPVALVPADRQNTQQARGVLPDGMDRADVVREAARAAHVVGGLAGVWPVHVAASSDLLHEPTRLEVMGATGALLRELRDAGVHAWLSGAGPTVAGAIPRVDDGSGEVVRAAAEHHGFRLHELDWDLRGLLVCPDDGCGLSGSPGCVQCPTQRV